MNSNDAVTEVLEHDPLCPLSQPCSGDVPEHGYCGNALTGGYVMCIHCERECRCEEYARVREDERKTSCAEDLNTDCPCYQEGRNHAIDDTALWEPHYQAGYTHGYGAARRDAVEAVRAAQYDWTEGDNCTDQPCSDCETFLQSIAAIEALGGEQ